MPINLNNVMSIKETCTVLGISKPSLYKLCKEEDVEFVKYNGCSFIEKDIVQQWSKNRIFKDTVTLEYYKEIHRDVFGERVE